MCPPPYLILCSLRHAAKTSAIGTIVVPAWPSAPFWPIIFPGKDKTAVFIRDIIVLPKFSPVLLPGRQGCILPACDLLFIRFDFKRLGALT